MITACCKIELISEDAPVKNSGVGWGVGPILHERTIEMHQAGPKEPLMVDKTNATSIPWIWDPDIPVDDENVPYRWVVGWITTGVNPAVPPPEYGIGFVVDGTKFAGAKKGVVQSVQAQVVAAAWIGEPHNPHKGMQAGVYHYVEKVTLGSSS